MRKVNIHLSNWKKIWSLVDFGPPVLICLTDKYVADEINFNRISIYKRRYEYPYCASITNTWEVAIKSVTVSNEQM